MSLKNVLQLGYRGGTTSLGEPDPALDLRGTNQGCGHAIEGEGEDVEAQRFGREQKQMKRRGCGGEAKGCVTSAEEVVGEISAAAAP